jgi:hypothetical protein
LLDYGGHSPTASRLWLNNVSDSVVEPIEALPPTAHVYRISGAKTQNLFFKGSVFRDWSRSISLDADVPQRAVHTPTS